ncbi:MAG TPA: ATPase [Candidatus Aphodoplasma excrementigallinarum]|uniref:ATPase n=1 Tax=Candidatus Aphodoplasma excrementigallinarum TaxID=2840673 RepID=A0A9D1SZ50_9FIRM|nr:ATPase [Candidatus Aphodoplasma excrementigallinarum]
MEVLEIIDMLEDVVEKSMAIPFAGRAVVDREELLDLIQEIRLNLPGDLKQAKWVKEERQRILDEANKEAESIMKNAEEKMASMIDDHEITQKAYAQANQIIAAAQNNARELRLGTRQYADDVMASLEAHIAKVAETVHENRRELNETPKEKKAAKE